MTLREVYKSAKQHGRSEIVRFMKDMKGAGLRMRFYRGRFYWTGPAVVTDDLQNVLSSTKIKCQWDNLGLQYIVYPKECL